MELRAATAAHLHNELKIVGIAIPLADGRPYPQELYVMSKVWFITGSSRGFGREFALAALKRGDQVAATARDTKTLTDLVERFGDAVLPLRLDVTDRAQVFEAVAAAKERFGRLDAQGSGHIVQISSAMGVATFAGTGGYSASKWALEGLSEALSQEVAAFGIKVTLIEPGGFATDFANSSVFTAHRQDAYDTLHASLNEMGASAQMPGPEAVGGAILQLVDAEEPPLRVFFGEEPSQWVPAVYQQRLETWAEWAHVSKAAEGK